MFLCVVLLEKVMIVGSRLLVFELGSNILASNGRKEIG